MLNGVLIVNWSHRTQLKHWQTLDSHSNSIIFLLPIQILNLVWPDLIVGIIKHRNKIAEILKLDIAAVSAFQFIIDENRLLIEIYFPNKLINF